MPSFDDYFTSEYRPSVQEHSPLEIFTERYERMVRIRERSYWSPESIRFRHVLGRSAQILREHDITTEPHTLTVGATRRLVSRRIGGHHISDWSSGHEVVDAEGWHLLPDEQSYITDRNTQRFLSAKGDMLTHSNRATIGLAENYIITRDEAYSGDPLKYEERLYISSEVTWRDFVSPKSDPEGGNFFLEDDELKFTALCTSSYCDHARDHIVVRSFEAEFARTVASALSRFQKERRAYSAQ